MFDNLVRSYVVIGVIVFGLRVPLYELGMAPWMVILSMAVALEVLYGVNHAREVANWIRSQFSIQSAQRRVV